MIEGKVVTDIYTLLDKNNVKIWIDGGWGVDALIGKQTRAHKDLDIAVSKKDIAKLRKLLKEYKESKSNSNEENFVLEDNKGHKIDVHVFEFDSMGNNIYGILYPLDSLSGKGNIEGKDVRCISPEWVLKFHSYYEPEEKDLKDIEELCKKFDLNPPQNYIELRSDHVL